MFGREPARILAVIGAGLALAVGFGLSLSGQQVNLIMVFAAAAITLIAGEATRSQVVPVEKANAQIEIALAEPSTTTVKQVIAKEEATQ
jgi:hypothetical protein